MHSRRRAKKENPACAKVLGLSIFHAFKLTICQVGFCCSWSYNQMNSIRSNVNISNSKLKTSYVLIGAPQ